MTRRTKEEIDTWLNDLYLECIQNEIPHSQREFELISRIDDFLGVWSKNNIPEKDHAIRWIRDRCKQGSDLLPISIFAFYYDTEFWEVKLFEVYGSVTIDPRISLTDMPYILITHLSNNFSDMELYKAHWANCIDLINGLNDLRILSNHPLHSNILAKDFLFSGVENLNTATSSLLYTASHNNQIIMNIRMALEMFIKSYVLIHENLTRTPEQLNDRALDIGHKLQRGLNAIKKLNKDLITTNDDKTLQLFPSIDDRYKPQNIEINDIAACYNLALRLGAMVTRSITDRNILNQ